MVLIFINERNLLEERCCIVRWGGKLKFKNPAVGEKYIEDFVLCFFVEVLLKLALLSSLPSSNLHVLIEIIWPVYIIYSSIELWSIVQSAIVPNHFKSILNLNLNPNVEWWKVWFEKFDKLGYYPNCSLRKPIFLWRNCMGFKWINRVMLTVYEDHSSCLRFS